MHSGQSLPTGSSPVIITATSATAVTLVCQDEMKERVQGERKAGRARKEGTKRGGAGWISSPSGTYA